MTEPEELPQLIIRLKGGDQEAFAALFSFYHDRLWNMVRCRLDPSLASRVDPDDILQEAYLEAYGRLRHFVDHHSGSFYVWLRMITAQTMVNLHRKHVGAQMRSASREIPLSGGARSSAATTSLALQLLGHLTSPSQVAMKRETAQRLQEVIEAMSEIDREVLMLRHFEQLTNQEISEVLGIAQKAASIRYIRAIKRLKDKLSDDPNFVDSGSQPATGEAESPPDERPTAPNEPSAQPDPSRSPSNRRSST